MTDESAVCYRSTAFVFLGLVPRIQRATGFVRDGWLYRAYVAKCMSGAHWLA